MAYEILDVIRRKVPLLTLLIQTFIVNIFYRECVNDPNYKLWVWIYFPFLCLFCVIWETIYGLRMLAKHYQHKSIRSRIILSIISAILSMSIFFTASYYVEAGRPFSCVSEYNKDIATVLFYTNIGLLLVFSAYEHYKWGVRGSLLPLYIQHNKLNDKLMTPRMTSVDSCETFGK